MIPASCQWSKHLANDCSILPMIPASCQWSWHLANDPGILPMIPASCQWSRHNCQWSRHNCQWSRHLANDPGILPMIPAWSRNVIIYGNNSTTVGFLAVKYISTMQQKLEIISFSKKTFSWNLKFSVEGESAYSIGHKKRAGQKKRAVFQTSAVYLK